MCELQFVRDESKCEPKEFDQGDDVHAQDEAQETSDCREEINPSHSGFEGVVQLWRHSLL